MKLIVDLDLLLQRGKLNFTMLSLVKAHTNLLYMAKDASKGQPKHIYDVLGMYTDFNGKTQQTKIDLLDVRSTIMRLTRVMQYMTNDRNLTYGELL